MTSLCLCVIMLCSNSLPSTSTWLSSYGSSTLLRVLLLFPTFHKKDYSSLKIPLSTFISYTNTEKERQRQKETQRNMHIYMILNLCSTQKMCGIWIFLSCLFYLMLSSHMHFPNNVVISLLANLCFITDYGETKPQCAGELAQSVCSRYLSIASLDRQ